MTSRITTNPSGTAHPISIVPTRVDNLKDFPQEMFDLMFSYLNQQELENAVVSKKMKSAVIVAASSNGFIAIRELATFLLQRLDPETFSLQNDLLSDILEEISSYITPENPAPLNLVVLKRKLSEIQQLCINIGKTLDLETLDQLKEPLLLLTASRCPFLKGVDFVPSARTRDQALADISKALAGAGNIDRALQVANTIEEADEIRMPISVNTKTRALRDISLAVAKAGNVDRALLIADTIQDANIKADALRAISVAVAEAGNIDRALLIVNTIQNDDHKEWAFHGISIALVGANNIDSAIQVTKRIQNNLAKGSARSFIARALAQRGAIQRAVDITETIQDDEIKGWALSDISQALVQLGDIGRATETANRILDEITRNRALQNIPVSQR